MKFDLRYLLVLFIFPFTLLFDRFMYPYFAYQGISYVGIGIIDAIFSAAALFSLYFLGSFSDKIGRRKAFAILMLYQAPFSLIYLKVSNFFQGALSRIFQSPTYMLFPVMNCYEQDLLKHKTKKKATFFGVLSTITGVAGFFVPLVGGIIIEWFGFFALGVISFLIGLLFVPLVLYLPDTSRPMNDISLRVRVKFNAINRSIIKGFSLYYLFTGISVVIVWIWIPFLSLQVTESYGLTGLILSFSGFFLIFGRVPFGSLADKYGKKKAFIIAGILSPLSLFLLGISSSLIVLLASSLLASLSASIRYPAENAILSDYIKPDDRGGVFSMFGIFTRIGVIIGGILGGVLVTVYDTSSVFLFAAIFELTAILIFIYSRKIIK